MVPNNTFGECGLAVIFELSACGGGVAVRTGRLIAWTQAATYITSVFCIDNPSRTAGSTLRCCATMSWGIGAIQLASDTSARCRRQA